MTTQATQVQTVSKQLPAGTPGRLVFQANDLAGAAIDVSSGFTAALQYRKSDALISDGATAISSGFTLGADGSVTLDLDVAAVNALPRGQSPMRVIISDDSMSTYSIIAKGTIQALV